MNIILLGPPGSGKGTQASLLSNQYSIQSISTGDLLRQEVSSGSIKGQLIRDIMGSGKLVDNKIVIEIIENKINSVECKNGFILDGFPRNISQAEELEKMLNKINKKIDIIFNFVIDDETLIKRISGRYSCSKCGMLYNKHFNNPKVEGKCDSCLSQDFKTRSDDSEEIVKNRIIVYNELSLPLLEFYKKKCLIVSVDTLKIVPLIFEDLKSNINNLKI